MTLKGSDRMFKRMVIIILLLSCIGCQSKVKMENVVITPPEQTMREYQVNILIDPDTKRYHASLMIKYTNTSEDTLDAIYFRDYPSYFDQITQITNIFADDHPTSMVRYEDPTVFSIPLVQSLKTMETVIIKMDYSASIPCLAGRFGYQEKGEIKDYYLGNSLPILSVYEDGQWSQDPYFSVGECFYSEIANYDVYICAPADYEVIATGDKTKMDDTHYHFDAKNVRDFAIVLGNDYQCLTATIQGIDLYSYYHTDNQEAGLNALENAGYGLIEYNASLTPYPYATLNVVETFTDMQGMEYPGLIMVSDSVQGDRYVVCHELLHQWFYGIVGNNEYQAAWIDEALCVYFAQSLAAPQITTINHSYHDFTSDGDYVRAVYFAGGTMYKQLEKNYGRNRVLNVVLRLLKEYGYKEINSKQYIDLLTDEFGEDNPILKQFIQ